MKHLKQAWASLRTKRAVLVILALIVMVGGAWALFRPDNTESEVVSLVAAANDRSNLVLGSDAVFENKVLEFLKVDKLCAITQELAELLKQDYTYVVREYYIAQQAKTVFVLYIDGPRASLASIEKITGPIDDGYCRVVHGKKMIALLAQ